MGEQEEAVNFLDPRLPDRFWSKCIPEPNSGCWLWFGATTSNGYASTSTNRIAIPAHKAAYLATGRECGDLDLDHLCRTRNCVNPAHLELVTHRENVLRGVSPSAVHARKTTCPKGHEYDKLDCYGRRKCSRCLSAFLSKRDASRYRSRLDSGMCGNCGKNPPMPSKTQCQVCRTAQSRRESKS